MTGAFIGLNLKYLPWQITVPILFGMAIACMYCAFRGKAKTKVANILFFFLALEGGFMVIKTLAAQTGMFVQYLPMVEMLDVIGFVITMILVLVLYIVLL